MRQKLQHAFSLVELMTVLSIVSILTAVALPKFNLMKINAIRTTAYTNLSHFFTLNSVYIDENQQMPVFDFIGPYDNDGTVQCEGVKNPLGFTLTGDCLKSFYAYHLDNNKDYLQNSTGEVHGSSYWSIVALASFGNSSADWGKRFPVNVDGCTDSSYRDLPMFNQDREFGIAYENIDSLKAGYDIYQQCF